MASTPTPERIRLTITVTPEVHAAFTRLADVSNASLGRAMGDWLGDTVEAAEYAATLMERARAAPKEVMREVHAYALGVADEAGGVLEALRQKRGSTAGHEVVPPRLVIRGGKSPGKTLGSVAVGVEDGPVVRPEGLIGQALEELQTQGRLSARDLKKLTGASPAKGGRRG